MAHDHDHASGHECGKCGQTFSTEEELKTHALEAHDVEL